MMIQSLTICNFKNYCGEHTLDLSTDPDSGRNIILIGGMNGAGKTTIFEAVQLCMFGAQFQGKTLSKSKYDLFLRKAKNKISTRDGDDNFFIEALIKIDDVFPVYTITLKREWVICDNTVEESFSIRRDGIPFEIVSQEYWEEYIASIIPPYITDYFFFDGERMKELTAGDEAETILRESARDLIGLKLYETLIGDLASLQKKIRHKAVNNDKTKSEIEDLEDNIVKIKQKIDELQKEENHYLSLKTDLESKICEHEGELQRKAGLIATKRKKIEISLYSEKESLKKINDDIEEILSVVPFVMAGDLVNKTIRTLKSEKMVKDLTGSKHLLEDVWERFRVRLATMDQLKLTESQRIQIRDELLSIFDEMSNDLSGGSKQKMIHDITNESFNRIEQFFNTIDEIGRISFKKRLYEREDLLLNLKKLEAQLNVIPEDSIVKDDLEEITELKKEIDKITKHLYDLGKETAILNHEYIPLQKKLDTIEYNSLKAEEEIRKDAMCNKVSSVLQEFVQIILSSKVKELEELVISMHCRLANKKDQVRKITVNPDTFEVNLYDYMGDAVPKDLLSAGEKEIFAISVLWALSRLAHTNLPVIVDSLLGRLDGTHVDKVALEFLPNAGDQVIILSHSREVDRDLYEKLKPHINATYLLSYDQVGKISEGYFFD